MPRSLQVAAFIGALLYGSGALAQNAPAIEGDPVVAPLPPSASQAKVGGWVVVVTSLAAGAALTTYGLTINCKQHDHSCHRRASLPIWGGVGAATVGSLVGLYVVQLPEGGARGAAFTIGGRFN